MALGRRMSAARITRIHLVAPVSNSSKEQSDRQIHF